jgi:5-(aminomethyl)-3-furanmethanol phosphate kinase
VETHRVIVAKVGGSLFTEPELGSLLSRWLSNQSEPVVLVPGGGGFADAVRELDAIHTLSETASHWLAIRSLSVSRHFLLHLLNHTVEVLDCQDFFKTHDLTPHTWAVTSDTLAMAYAQHQRASKLVLLKSVAMPVGMSWEEAAAVGLVDEFFPVQWNKQPMAVDLVNLRG